MRRREIKRGLHRRIEFRSDNGELLNWGQLTAEERQEIANLGFHGFRDFLQKAESLANEQLAANGLPTDWPIPTKLRGTDIDGWYVPDECEPAALRGMQNWQRN